MAISASELQRFFQSVGVKEPCTQCSQPNWGYDENAPGVQLLTEETDTHPKIVWTTGIPALYLFCINCGYIRIFAAGHIKHWLEQHPAEVASDGK